MTAGRRWYLAAWDRHRHDWRMFRLDRLRVPDRRESGSRPRAPQRRCSGLVEHAIGSTPRDRVAVLVLGAPLDDLADVLRWVDHEVREAAAGSTVVEVRGEDVGRLAMTAARLALTTSVRVIEPDDLGRAVERLGTHSRAVSRSAQGSRSVACATARMPRPISGPIAIPVPDPVPGRYKGKAT